MRAKQFCRKCFIGVTVLECSYGNFHPSYRDLGRENRELGNRASPASRVNTSIFLQRKEWRGEISETDPARLSGLMKKPYAEAPAQEIFILHPAIKISVIRQHRASVFILFSHPAKPTNFHLQFLLIYKL